MAYLELDEIKRHLNIEDTRYFGEDAYLRHLGEVAEQAVEQHICQPLASLEDADGKLPAPLKHAMLLYVGDLYASRESNVYGVAVNRVPFAYDYLCALYKKYDGGVEQ